MRDPYKPRIKNAAHIVAKQIDITKKEKVNQSMHFYKSKKTHFSLLYNLFGTYIISHLHTIRKPKKSRFIWQSYTKTPAHTLTFLLISTFRTDN